ncbi:hypothetical protein ACS5PU_18645 [Pedobacter sp. GSP4]|uniref:hypothetical protein n=1 Tax=Pedobacter sp. GSP4 TaxID=3453716 RepID=UPI003EE851F1
MDNILKVFKYAGLSLVFIALVSISNHLISAVGNYNNGQLAVSLVEQNAAQEVKSINSAKFTNSHIGVYEFKPTFTQAIVLSGKGLGDVGASAAFYLILGVAILIVAYNKPKNFENLTENRLWQFVAAGGILFMALKFVALFLVNGYVADLTGSAFKYRNSDAGDINLGILSLFAILSVIYELLSYSRKLKQENDLTI